MTKLVAVALAVAAAFLAGAVVGAAWADGRWGRELESEDMEDDFATGI